jgi:hypothetical protein
MSGVLKPAVPTVGDLGWLSKIVGSGHVSCRVAFIPTIVQLRRGECTSLVMRTKTRSVARSALAVTDGKERSLRTVPFFDDRVCRGLVDPYDRVERTVRRGQPLALLVLAGTLMLDIEREASILVVLSSASICELVT